MMRLAEELAQVRLDRERPRRPSDCWHYFFDDLPHKATCRAIAVKHELRSSQFVVNRSRVPFCLC